MTTRRRLTPEARRAELLDVGERLFAERPYDEVLMEGVAAEAGVSRALLYRHFPAKPDLFAAVYRRAADRLLDVVHLDPARPLADQVAAGLDAHIDYFVAHRRTVLAANRRLAGDPAVQAIIADELDVLRRRLVDVAAADGRVDRGAVSAVLAGWLVFVRQLSVAWLADEPFDRGALRDVGTAALLGALAALPRRDPASGPASGVAG